MTSCKVLLERMERLVEKRCDLKRAIEVAKARSYYKVIVEVLNKELAHIDERIFSLKEERND